MRHSINRQGIQRLQYEPYMHVAMLGYAEAVAIRAKGMAPKRTGKYAASIGAQKMGYKWARSRVYARDFKAYWIEFGAGPSPVRGGRPFLARHPLAEAAIATGLRFDNRYAGE